MQFPDAALGAIIAAVVTSVAGLLGLIISKENKVSEYRLAWIEALRDQISELYSCLISIRVVLRREGRTANANDLVARANEHFANVRLRLNRRDAKYELLTNLLDEIEVLYAPEGQLDYERMAAVKSYCQFWCTRT